MKIKKLVSGVTMLALTTVLLAACGGDKKDDTAASSSTEASSSVVAKDSSSTEESSMTIGELKDGEYKLEEKNYNNGYRVVFTIVVKDGKITESNYDNVNEAGKSKVDDAEYNKKMEEVTKTSPKKYIPELNKALLEKQNPSDIDTITGATHSTDSFKEYAKQLIEAAEKGDTKTIEIDNQVEK
ncbi:MULTISPECIES: FMN-binding protein [Enterococcaceae]|uniref:FMN-binding protein n=1 Tax=Enterococcaceae TaxID=81852 RepID=UPI000E47D646|nr:MULTISPECIES: FMN-binding protein [Enterococcaceae]MCI0131299.1 FMN-binding protein [Vagococcus sp. CY53-2]RGI29057.1 FMN-binding protein [Melissococcus sp. OM08-11BH]UNM89558.1 FMN-binding protein [Vagococcus sp. CY52-2]